MKFGGTSVQDAAAFRRVAEIAAQRRDVHPVVVVSAMSRMTDALVNAFDKASNQDVAEAIAVLRPHLDRHLAVAAELLSAEKTSIESWLKASWQELETLLGSLATAGESPSALKDEVVSYGERLSSNLLAAVMRAQGLNAEMVDGRRCIITDEQYGHAVPLSGLTEMQTRANIEPLVAKGKIPVIGGFIAVSQAGLTSTLGRGGSDYSAALIGAALNAQQIQIWTDVSGVLTADPRIVRNARAIPRLSYAEAAELAYFGAKVLHPKTIQPGVARKIPFLICNSHAPDDPGTLICAEGEMCPGAVKSIALKTGITTVLISSDRMLGAYGFLRALFEVFDRHRTAVDIVTTSEVSVSLSLDDDSALPEILRDLESLGTVEVERNRGVICVVGEGVRATKGVAGRIFNAVSDIKIFLISQGASRINMTFVISEADVATAVQRLHTEFFE
jgi:aspartate kinase